MNAKLTCLDYSAAPAEILLETLPFIIGRCGEAQICLDDRWVSRRHCELVEEDGVLVVRDLGSKYGTFVNGRPVSRAELLPGDMLSVGLSNFVAGYDLPAGESGVFQRGVAMAILADTPFQLAGQA